MLDAGPNFGRDEERDKPYKRVYERNLTQKNSLLMKQTAKTQQIEETAAMNELLYFYSNHYEV